MAAIHYQARIASPPRTINFDAIRAAFPLPSIVGESVKLRRAGSEWRGLCPFHGERTPSFFIFDGGRRFHCFGCGASGDVIDYVSAAFRVSTREAVAMLGAAEPMPRILPVEAPQGDDNAQRVAEARSIWNGAERVPESPVAAYLIGRGIPAAAFDQADLRHAVLTYGRDGPAFDCMIAAVRNAAGEVTGVQRTYLASGGAGKARVPTPKLSLGNLSGGAIRLAPPAECMAIAEGIETALSFMALSGLPTWATAGTSMMPRVRFPEIVREVVIAADGDAPGRAAAAKAADAYAAAGLTVRTVTPAPGFGDFNDEIRGARS